MKGFAYAVADDGTSESIAIDAAPGAAGALVWTHLLPGDDAVRGWLRDRARLPRALAEALTAAETRPRCDPVGDGAVINLRGLARADQPIDDRLASIRIYVTAGRVWSVSRVPVNAVERACEAVKRGKVRDPGDLVTVIATAIAEELDPIVADLGDALDDCEERLDAHQVFELRRAVTRVRIEAIALRRFVLPQRTALERLASFDAAWLSAEDRLHLSGTADRTARMAEELEAIRERSALVHEALTDLRAELIDQRSLVIAVVAMVFLPLTFVTGLLGMNVEGIPYAREPWAFWGVVGMCVAMAVAIAAYFVRRHWFR